MAERAETIPVEFRRDLQSPAIGELFVACRPTHQVGERPESVEKAQVANEILDSSGSLAASQPALALAVFERGVEALWSGCGKVEKIVVPNDPTLDDMLALSFAERLLAGDALPPGTRAVAEYASLARAGFRPGKVSAEESIEGIFLAIRNDREGDLDRPEIVATFLDRFRHFAAALFAFAEAEKNPFTTPLAKDSADFRREQIYLEADRRLYDDDVASGERWTICFPGHSRRISGLVLRHPKSLLFKYWCREDAGAPAAGKYSLLAVKTADASWVVSTDPTDRVSLKLLADALQAAENSQTPAGTEPYVWFDGARFEHTLIASPRGGTRLSDEQILHVVRHWAHAKAASSRRRRSLAVAVGSLLLLSLAAISLAPWRPAPHDEARGLRIAESSIGDPLPVIDSRGYALLLATNNYDHWADLGNPINDVEKVDEILRTDYKFDTHIVKNPDKKHFLSVIGDYMARPYGAFDRLLIYVAGHGDFRVPTKEGFIATKDSKTPEEDPTHESFIPLSQLRSILEVSDCPHIFLMVDVCFGGTIDFNVVMNRGEPAVREVAKAEFVRRKLKYRSRHFLTSGAKELVPDGVPGENSPFASEFIRLLKDGTGPDGILTSHEILPYVEKATRAEPRYGPLGQDQGGDFLFIRAS